MVVWLAGCAVELDLEQRTAATVTSDCVLPGGPRTAAISLEFVEAGASVWIWGTAEGPDGPVDAAVSVVTDRARACADGVSLVEDDDGRPVSILTLTPAEQLANASRQDGRRLVLEPIGGFVHDGVGFLYYAHALLGPGFFDRERLGAGLCRMPSPGAVCARASEAPLWGPNQPAPGESGFVGDDGRVLLARRVHAAAFDDFCTFARVFPEDAADPTAYEYAGLTAWSSDPAAAVRAFDATGRVTLRDQPWIGRPVATVADIWSPSVAMRVLAEPDGSVVGSPVTLFAAVPPGDWFIGGGSEHAALGSADGREIVVSYSTDPTGAGPDLHLVTLRLAGEGP